MNKSYRTLAKSLSEVVKEAGKVIFEEQTQGISLDKLGRPVIIDNSRSILLSELKRFRSYGIVIDGKEFEREKGKHVWFASSLDGVDSYIDKSGNYSINIGLCYEGKPVLGVLYDPLTEELYISYFEGDKKVAEKKDPFGNSVSLEVLSHQKDNPNTIERVVIPYNATDEEIKDYNFPSDSRVIKIGSMGLGIMRLIEKNIDSDGKARSIADLGFIGRDGGRTSLGVLCAPHFILEAAGGSLYKRTGRRKVNYNGTSVEGILVATKDKAKL